MSWRSLLIWPRSWKGPGKVLIFGRPRCVGTLCNVHTTNCINWLWPSDVIWRQRTWSTLIPVIACFLTAPSHHLNQCCLIISEVLWHSPEVNFTGNAQDIHEMSLKITNLRLQPHLPGANELRCLTYFIDTCIWTFYCEVVWLRHCSTGQTTEFCILWYCKTFSISRTESQNLNVSRLALQLSLPNPLKPCVKSSMKM